MTRKRFLLLISIFSLIILAFGGVFFALLFQWNSLRESIPLYQTPDSAAIATQAAQTVIAEITQQAIVASAETSTLIPSVSETSRSTLPPEAVLPTPTLVPPTLIVPPITPFPPTMIIPTFTQKPQACDRAQLVQDVSVADNSPFAPETTFVKIWRLKNTGSCTWTTDYNLVFRSGDTMNAKMSVPLPNSVAPDQTVDVAINMKSPKNIGTYRGDWLLSNASGTRFGIGLNGDQSFWVQIRVINFVNTNLIYDFAANYCKAEWSSGAGRIPCPGTNSATDGFVIVTDAPRLENRQEDEWTLLTHPNNHSRGWISGMYPEFKIQQNHHFTVWVGCLAESKGCNITFRLDIKNLANGNIRNLGSWHEVYDGEVTKIDLDLSEQAGKNVRFILTVEVSGGNPAMANAFWFVPGIILVQPSTITPTLAPLTDTPFPTEMPTDTLTPTETSTP